MLFSFLITPQSLSGQLEEKESELAAEKKNATKRDKTIQGLSILLKEKERQVPIPFRPKPEVWTILKLARTTTFLIIIIIWSVSLSGGWIVWESRGERSGLKPGQGSSSQSSATEIPGK